MKTNRLCCLVHTALRCKYCGEVFCIPCGGRMGEARHFKTNMCHTRFTPEQLRDSDRCYEDKSKPKKDCACCELYKKQGGRYGDRDIFDEDNYIHRLLKMPKVVKKRRHGKPPKFMKRKK